ncbi:peptide ABC transporter ATP-binding protein [Clostridia bacterium]|nr:peptide ABC transporter ATP-binding protein [Clostridia bacterium]
MNTLLKVSNLKVDFMTVRGIVHAVQGVDFSLNRGKTLGIVGESGCGKSVLVKSILRLHEEQKTRCSGNILFEGHNILDLSPREMLAIRGVRASMIFQDPMISLNPILKIGEQIAETFRARRSMTKGQAAEEALRLLKRVGITPAEERYHQYPFELSGGMLQRVVIAIAISLEPEILIADEATTALDMTVQKEILDLLKWLRKEKGMSLIVVTHDFGVVAEMCDSIAVMYAGKIMEYGSARQIFNDPCHPYTRALISSTPSGAKGGKLISIPGAPPELYEPQTGCAFYPRCSQAAERCRESLPAMHSASGNHVFRCERPQ